ncbi:MAG: SCO family protein [Cryobacterium sp.]|nr:SCO family protein [Oligoflexia bacterium]
MKLSPLKVALGALAFFSITTVALYFGIEKMNLGPKMGGDFTLSGKMGAVSLHDFKGKGVILYFGYTRCPDVCPVSLSRLRGMLKSLPEKASEKIVPLFVSVDYRSDTPAKVDEYAKFFMETAVGLTGTKEQINHAVSLYGTGYQFEETPKSAIGYTVQHGDRFYFINPRGKLVSTLPTTSPTSELKSAIESLL